MKRFSITHTSQTNNNIKMSNKKITMNLCVKANNLKETGQRAVIDNKQFKYLYGDYYSKKFMKQVKDECYFKIKYYYEDREGKKENDLCGVWCDMYWCVDYWGSDIGEEFEEECNRIKYYSYNGSSAIAMTMCGLDFEEEEDEEEEEKEEEENN